MPAKSPEQQGTLALHTARALLAKQQTMLSNAVRSLAAVPGLDPGIGLVAPQGFGKLGELVAQVEAEAGIPESARQALRALYGQFHAVREAAAELEAPIIAHARRDETARRLATILGVGPITASPGDRLRRRRDRGHGRRHQPVQERTALRRLLACRPRT